MIVVVLDTNVLASGAVSQGGAPAQVLDAALNGEFLMVHSQPILDELDRTLRRPYFAARLDDHVVTSFVTLLRAVARTIPVTAHVQGVATHPEDDVILATAVSAGASCLVTQDKHLRALGSVGDVTILSPGEFLEVLHQPWGVPGQTEDS